MLGELKPKGPKKTNFPKDFGKSEGTLYIQFRKFFLESGLKNVIRKVSEIFESVIDRLFEPLASQLETPLLKCASKKGSVLKLHTGF